jgi:hypothetical protein
MTKHRQEEWRRRGLRYRIRRGDEGDDAEALFFDLGGGRN